MTGLACAKVLTGKFSPAVIRPAEGLECQRGVKVRSDFAAYYARSGRAAVDVDNVDPNLSVFASLQTALSS